MSSQLKLGASLALIALFASHARSQSPLHELYGASSSDAFGRSVAGAGDVDGDGLDDVIVGAPFAGKKGRHSGVATVHSGADGSVIYTFYGGDEGDEFGFAVDGAGDVDGDGFADLIVGAPGHDSSHAKNAGAVRVYGGKSGALLGAFYGDAEGDRAGSSVSGAGDTNGDGFDDFLFGAPFGEDAPMYRDCGMVRLISGKSFSVRGTFYGFWKFNAYGWSVAGAGDVDNDGYADIIIGEPFGDPYAYINAGRVVVLSGKALVLIRVHTGTQAGAQFGFSVGGAGDVDGDGRDDVIVGAPYDDTGGFDAGRIQVFSDMVNGAPIFDFVGIPGDQFGYAVDIVGDVNGDGRAEFLASGPHRDVGDWKDAGAVWLFEGEKGQVINWWTGEAAGDQFGQSAARAGDTGASGHPDTVIGAPRNDKAGVNAGKAVVVRSF